MDIFSGIPKIVAIYVIGACETEATARRFNRGEDERLANFQVIAQVGKEYAMSARSPQLSYTELKAISRDTNHYSLEAFIARILHSAKGGLLDKDQVFELLETNHLESK